MKCDVAIIGGGPAGSTLGAYLRKYAPDLSVTILERERFPRDHVGESQLPPISRILEEIGAWDKVEAAGFPIKVGATYRWGKRRELWDFEFVPRHTLGDEPRPAAFEGARRWTAFQVDRAVYDQILLDHAQELGCDVHQETKVAKVYRDGDRVKGLELEDGDIVTARHYVDASGHSGLLRRAMGVGVTVPTSLQNIAIWDYWQNAEWAETVGVGGTFVQVLSLGWGWVWFIPLGPTRTSIGLITPAEYYKASGESPEALYRRALAEEPMVQALTANATSEGSLSTTKDWSFLADRLVGENWFLVGESAGFADPILAAGMSLAQKAAQEAAFTILELDRGEHDAAWLKAEYERINTRRIRNHIRFADYWYTTNEQFEDLKEFTSKIAEENGLELTPDKAWQWLAQGGFIEEGNATGIAGFSLEQVRNLGEHLVEVAPTPGIDRNNVFHLALDGASKAMRAGYVEGRVRELPHYVRGARALAAPGVVDLIVTLLRRSSERDRIAADLREVAEQYAHLDAFLTEVLKYFAGTLDAMILDGWVTASYDSAVPMDPLPNERSYIDWLQTPAAV